MAYSYSPEYYIGGNDRKYRGYVEAWAENVSDTVTRIHWKATLDQYNSYYYGVGVNCFVDGKMVGQTVGHLGSNPGRRWVYVIGVEGTTDVARDGSDRSVWVQCNAFGYTNGGYGSAGGSVAAGVSVTVPHRTWYSPRPPKSPSATRASDSQARVTWQTDYTGGDGAYPWTGVHVERRTDGGAWVQVGSASWSVTNFTDNGLSAGHRYQWRVRSYNLSGTSAYATTGYVYTTPLAPSSVTLTRAGGTTVSIGAPAVAWATSYEVQTSLNGGAWAAAGTVASLPISVDVGGGVVRARVRAKVASLSGPWRESGSVQTVVAPSAPALTSAPSGTYPVGTAAGLAWAANHPDGSPVTAVQVELTVDGAATVYDLPAGSASWAVPDSAISAPHSVSARVRTKGLANGWGAWSAMASWRVAYSPQVEITSPATDGSLVESVPFDVTWRVADSTGVSSQSVELLDSTGASLMLVDPGADARSWRFSARTYLPRTGQSYVARVAARGGSSLLSVAERRFSTDYAEPATPAAEVLYDYSDMSATVVVRHGNPSWEVVGWELVSPEDNAREEGIPVTAGADVAADGTMELGAVLPTVSVSVVRMLADGTQWLVEDGMADGGAARDPLPPLNVAYSYLVTSYSEAGTATTLEVPARLDSDAEAYNFGPDAGRCRLLRFDATGEERVSHSGEEFHFALGAGVSALPTFYPDGDVDVSGSHSYVLTSREEYLALREQVRARDAAVCWLRDHWGNRWRVVAEWSLSYDAKAYMRWNVSASVREVVFEEAANG